MLLYLLSSYHIRQQDYRTFSSSQKSNWTALVHRALWGRDCSLSIKETNGKTVPISQNLGGDLWLGQHEPFRVFLSEICFLP